VGNKNRKATKAEMAHAREVIAAAFPDCTPIFAGHGAYGGHRAPRDHTLSFRLVDSKGRSCSNVVWLMPDDLATLSVAAVRARVKSR
jgi:hypothetical protein